MAKNNKQTAGQDGVSKMITIILRIHRTTTELRSHISCCAIAEGISSSNLSYISQGLM